MKMWFCDTRREVKAALVRYREREAKRDMADRLAEASEWLADMAAPCGGFHAGHCFICCDMLGCGDDYDDDERGDDYDDGFDEMSDQVMEDF